MSLKKNHPRNKHSGKYNLEELTRRLPALSPFLIKKTSGELTVNFHDPQAVKMLNKALLKSFYQIEYWDIPPGYLCPPVPGRADYIHHLADLAASENNGKIPKGKSIVCLDIGTGANCIYPIVGNREYGWFFIGSDIEPEAIESAKKIVENNSVLKNKIEIRRQMNPNAFFTGILSPDERVDFTICNPPFHASLAEAEKGTRRKLKNLRGDSSKKPTLNFGGKNNELWCEGGERNFILKMIRESIDFSGNCLWFSTLVSKESNLNPIEKTLNRCAVDSFKIIPLRHGNKTSRIAAWTFLNKKQRQIWVKTRWK